MKLKKKNERIVVVMRPCAFIRSDKETLANVKKYQSEKYV